MKQNQSGFSPLVLLVAVLVFVGVSTAAWYVWQATQNGSSSENGPQADSSSSSSPDEGKPVGYFLIPDKHVRLPLNEELSGIKSGRIGVSPLHASDQSVPIIVPSLDAGWTCEADRDGFKGTIGNVSISSQFKRSGPGDPAASKRLGDYTYGFEPGGASCTASEQYQKLVNAFKDRFRLLEEY